MLIIGCVCNLYVFANVCLTVCLSFGFVNLSLHEFCHPCLYKSFRILEYVWLGCKKYASSLMTFMDARTKIKAKLHSSHATKVVHSLVNKLMYRKCIVSYLNFKEGKKLVITLTFKLHFLITRKF